MKVLHILHRSVPGAHGYAIRSKEIVSQLIAKGIEPIVVTSPSQAPLGALDVESSEIIDRVRYFRSCGKLIEPTIEVKDGKYGRATLRVLQNSNLFRMAWRIARRYKPDVIHAHSPFTCGLVGDVVGRLTGIPVIYEMRGIWEDQHTSRYGMATTSFRYRGVRFLETLALKHADTCFAISNALKDEMIARGIDQNRIMIAPNGVDIRKFAPGEPDQELLVKLGLKDKLVIGYIGTFFHYEGLDLLAQSFQKLASQFPSLVILLVGDGELMPKLKSLATNSAYSDRFLFTGRIKNDLIVEYYKLFDLLVLPRRDAREANLVTPLKPLEIMAMAKPLVASNIGGHREIVTDKVNGLLFTPESIDDLSDKCCFLLKDKDYRLQLGETSRQWVTENRDWSVLIDKYIRVYEEISLRPKSKR
ncbi:MAG: glycosyltransferase [Desulfomonilaceae bacterium]